MSIIRLIRWKNLVLIALTQYMLRWFIIDPLLQKTAFNLSTTFKLQVNETDFLFLVLSWVSLAAGGYIINDYFDTRIDEINKPQDVIIGKKINLIAARNLYTVFTSTGILLGLYISLKLSTWKLFLIYFFAAFSLFWYSAQLKHHTLIGNLIIAFLASLIPLMVGLLEVPLLNLNYMGVLGSHQLNFNFIAFWVLGYTAFAFLLTLAREITKDLADMEGDKEYGSYTVPVAWGINTAKIIIVCIYILTILLLIYIQQQWLNDLATVLYMLFFILLPLSINIWLTTQASSRKKFLHAATLNKIMSLAGILYSLLVWYIIKNGPPL